MQSCASDGRVGGDDAVEAHLDGEFGDAPHFVVGEVRGDLHEERGAARFPLDSGEERREFVELLKTRQAKTEFATRLQLWLLEWDRGRTPEYDQLSAEVYTKRLNFYVAVDKLLTREQRTHALDRLQKFADDCRALSTRAPAHGQADDAALAAILALILSAADRA